jgi:hypothetical protein
LRGSARYEEYIVKMSQRGSWGGWRRRIPASSGTFAYTVAGYTLEDDAASDEFSTWASYNPWARAISDGAYEEVARNGRVTVPVTVDPVAFASQSPKGVMVVVMDNRSGAKEALLLGVR